jgi:hypothetical protein
MMRLMTILMSSFPKEVAIKRKQLLTASGAKRLMTLQIIALALAVQVA